MLNLDSTKVSDEGLAHLKDLVQLKDLRLFGTKITDAGILHLKNMTQLTRLCLGGRMPITDNRNPSDSAVRKFKAVASRHFQYYRRCASFAAKAGAFRVARFGRHDGHG